MNRRTFLKAGTALCGIVALPAAASTRVHQPFVVDRSDEATLLAAQPGDLIRCEAGCDYAEVLEAGDPKKVNGWNPKLELLNGNSGPVGRLMPIRCQCGAVAIRWGGGKNGQ